MDEQSDSKKTYSTDAEVRDALFEFLIFIVFLILTIFVVLSVRDPYMFYLNQTVDNLFVQRDITVASGVMINFQKLVTIHDLWDYMFFGFLGILHGGPGDGQGKALDEPPDKPPDNDTDANPDAMDDGVDPGEKPEKGLHERLWQPSTEDLNDDDIDLGGDVSDPADRYGNDTELQQADEQHKRVKRKGVGGGGGGGGGAGMGSGKNLIGRVFILENILLGPPRLRQIRVKQNSCYIDDAFKNYFAACFAEYSSGDELVEQNFRQTEFKTKSDIKATSIWAKIATYEGAGYVQDLTYDQKTNKAILTALQSEDWIDWGTRLVVIEWNMYNENLDIFQSNKLIAEVPPTGGIVTSAQIRSVKETTFFTQSSIIVTALIIAFYIMIIFYTIMGLNGIRKMGCRRYFTSLFNLLDTFILIVAYLAIGYNIWHMIFIRNVSNKAKSNQFISLDYLVKYNGFYVNIMALLCFFVCMKFFKFISFNTTLVQFTTTLKRCSKDLAGFSLMFLIVFLAYAQLGLLLFGTKHPDFRTFLTSVLTMIRMILGDFQYNLIEEANRILGPIFFLTYILLVFFILLNMFLAIIMQTYSSVKSEITHGRNFLGSFLIRKMKHLFYLIRYCGQLPPAALARVRNPGAFDRAERPGASGKSPAKVDEPQEPKQGGYQPPGSLITEKELNRLSNRVGLLEDMLEQLVTNMDRILKRVEMKKRKEN